jgi:periplasmic protein TonB
MPPTPESTAARERLVTLLFLTALLHAILLLGVTFSSGARAGRTTPGMEVLLVTEDAPAVEKNERAAYAAQRSQKGAGNTRDAATSSPGVQAEDPEEATEPGREGEENVLRTTARSPLVSYLGTVLTTSTRRNSRRGETKIEAQAGRGDGLELVLRGDPTTGKWISPDTRALKLAPYLDAWRRKIERLGTLNYPVSALRTGGHAAPVIEVALRADGSLQSAAVQRGSGDLALDQAALNILRLASPFSPFPPELAADYGVLRFAYQWEFEGGGQTSGAVTAPTNGEPAP